MKPKLIINQDIINNGIKLYKYDLSNCDLSKCILNNTNLSNCKLTNTNLSYCDFSNCNINYDTFNETILFETKWNNKDITSNTFNKTILCYSIFNNVTLNIKEDYIICLKNLISHIVTLMNVIYFQRMNMQMSLINMISYLVISIIVILKTLYLMNVYFGIQS